MPELTIPSLIYFNPCKDEISFRTKIHLKAIDYKENVEDCKEYNIMVDRLIQLDKEIEKIESKAREENEKGIEALYKLYFEGENWEEKARAFESGNVKIPDLRRALVSINREVEAQTKEKTKELDEKRTSLKEAIRKTYHNLVEEDIQYQALLQKLAELQKLKDSKSVNLGMRDIYLEQFMLVMKNFGVSDLELTKIQLAVAGSIGRREATPFSDIDSFMVFSDDLSQESRAKIVKAAEHLVSISDNLDQGGVHQFIIDPVDFFRNPPLCEKLAGFKFMEFIDEMESYTEIAA